MLHLSGEWDVVFLTMRLYVPFLFRKIDPNLCILVREAQIHGAMDGRIVVNGSIDIQDEAVVTQGVLKMGACEECKCDSSYSGS